MSIHKLSSMIVAVAVAVLLSFTGRSAWGEVHYTVTDLGTLGGRTSSAVGISDNGQVVGWSLNTEGRQHAFLYSNGAILDLGTLSNTTDSIAFGVNNQGQVVGESFSGNNPSYTGSRGFLYSNSAMQELGSLAGGNTQAFGINNAGQVVGESRSASAAHAFVCSGGTFHDLGTLTGSYSSALCINDNGDVVGYFGFSGPTACNSFLYTGGTMRDLGTLGGLMAKACAINNLGQVVGYSTTIGQYPNHPNHAFLYSDGTMHEVGTLLPGTSSQAVGINDAGTIVGSAGASGNVAHAFVYEDGIMTDLNDLIDPSSNWTLYNANAINNNGWIVGFGGRPGSSQEAFLLTPIPEPSTLVLLGIGALGLLGRAWRRRKLHKLSSMVLVGVVAVFAVVAQAVQTDTITHPNASGIGSTTINMDFVTVGDAGNAPDTEVMTTDGTTGYGAVGYDYRIGTYEVTAAQWAAVRAAAPTVGNSGSYSGSQPTAKTTWYEAAKFCNWLTTGDVNSGVYNTSTWGIMDHQTAGTTYGTAYFIPTEDEWYKASYFDPAKAGGTGGYWDYPTRSDSAPTAKGVSNQLGVAPGSANYNYAVGTPTNVGAYNLKPSTSAYGTFDQGGNVWEWNETAVTSSSRGLRGGCWFNGSYDLAASGRVDYYPALEINSVGFRVASVPEPGSLILLVTGAIAALVLWRRRK